MGLHAQKSLHCAGVYMPTSIETCLSLSSSSLILVPKNVVALRLIIIIIAHAEQ